MRLLTSKEAAERLGLKAATLYKWRAQGRGPRFVRLSGRAVRYAEEALGEWVREQEKRTGSEKPGPDFPPGGKEGEHT